MLPNLRKDAVDELIDERLKLQEAKKLNGHVQKLSQKIELPPKNFVRETEVDVLEQDCECGPDEACSKCIAHKDL